jgi:hypothetical protein
VATKRTAKKAPRKAPTRRGVGVADLRAAFARLDGVEEGTSYGTVAWKLKKKFLARMKEDGVTLVLRAPFELRDALLESDPETFFLTDHYANYPAVLVRLARVRHPELAALLGQAAEFVGGAARRSR